MSKVNEIMEKYTAGEITAEEANAKLAAAEAGFHLEPGKNVLTEEEMRATTIGHFPDQANGFGLLDSGTGTLDKVRVKDGRLVNCDMGESYALLIIAGRTYRVFQSTPSAWRATAKMNKSDFDFLHICQFKALFKPFISKYNRSISAFHSI